MMTYDEALGYIHSVSNFFCKPGLERVRELCRGLGDPQKELKFIHVAGTNGKGSTSAMLDSILRMAGYKVGLFTSPYVREFNERMRVDGRNIPNDTLARLTERAKKVAEKMADSPTEFELITAIAFDYFRESRCELVVLEVGMGGRLDATNIIDPPLLSIITSIALDHTSFLGSTTAEIAVEKAGIIKTKSPTLWGGTDPDAEAVIMENAAKMESVLYKTDYSELKIKSFDPSGTEINYKGKEAKIPLLGAYQPRNAATVLEAVEILRNEGISIPDEAIKKGLLGTKWQARFEIIAKNPTVIFDGAHNHQGILAATESIKGYFKDKKVVILSGILADKDYNAVAQTLATVADTVYTITPSNPRALSAEEYASVIRSHSCPAVACGSVAEALALGISRAKEIDTALCCLGSLYTYAEVMANIEKSDA